MTDEVIEKAKESLRYAIIKCHGHYLCADRSGSTHMWFGVPVIVTTTVVGTSLFATLSQSGVNVVVGMAAGLISLLASILSSLQTFFRFAEKAEQHKAAAAGFENLRTQLELFLLRYPQITEANRGTALETLEKILQGFADLSRQAPPIPDRIYDAAKREQQRPAE
jgi:hypothetical protein